MAKKTDYSCQSCGAIHFKWSGKCPDCGAWNSLVEEYGEGGGSHFTRITKENNNKNNQTPKLKLTKISENINDFKRISTSINELDRVLGGGLVQGSVILIGGSPGIGKSTLLLQTASKLSQSKKIKSYIFQVKNQ